MVESRKFESRNTSIEAGESDIPFDDRGLAYGDGLFETVLVRDGRALLWEAHLARLAEGAQRLGLSLPGRDRLDRLPALAGPGERVLKLIVTRGSGGRGYAPPDYPETRLRWRFGDFSPRRERWQAGVDVRLCRLRLAEQPALAGIKHLNRLENVLARREWSCASIAEGLLCDQSGRLVEATAMNLAWRDGDRWYTPGLAHCGVAGTLRRVLLDEGLLEAVEGITPEALKETAGVVLFNSVQGVWPVMSLFDTACHRRLCCHAIDESLRQWQKAAHQHLGHVLPPDTVP